MSEPWQPPQSPQDGRPQQPPVQPGGWQEPRTPPAGGDQPAAQPPSPFYPPPQPPQYGAAQPPQPYDQGTGPYPGYQQQPYPGQSGPYPYAPAPQQTNSMATAGLILAILCWPLGLIMSIIGFNRSKQLGGVGRDLAIAGMVIAPIAAISSLALFGAFGSPHGAGSGTGGTVTAPAGPGTPPGGVANGAAGQDPGCQAMQSVLPNLTSQIAADSGNFAASVQVLQTMQGDVQNAAQKTQSIAVQTALVEMNGALENMIVDEQNLMEGSTDDDSQLNSDTSAFTAAAGNLGTACGWPS